MGTVIIPVKERLLAKRLISSCGCWVWLGTVSHNGYGMIHYNRKNTRVHRLAYELLCGKIPEGLYVLHHCDVPSCFNPEHLFVGDKHANMQDCWNKGRHPWQTGEHPVTRGVDHYRTILTPEAVKAIRAHKYKHGDKAAMARKYGISPRQIFGILRRDTWKHL
ncbi:MAG: hypothetical protein DRI65_06115 [Chloroflexota bacterium]|nr:MAG: hypothetical protein DRI65_06115 [Chloroflexota bacterium]